MTGFLIGLLLSSCPGGAEVDGPAADRLRPHLGPRSCSGVNAVARMRGTRIVVTLSKGGNRERRSFGTPQSAASWIRSWGRADLVDALLPSPAAAPEPRPRVSVAPPRPAVGGGGASSASTGVWTPSVSARADLRRATLNGPVVNAAFEPAAGSEGSLWAGLSASIAWPVLLRPTLGLRVGQSLPHRPDARLTAVERRQVEVLVGGGHRWRLPGSIELGAGLGLGGSWIQANRSEAGRDGCVTNCPPLVPDRLTDVTVQPVGELSIEGWMPVHPAWRVGIALRGSIYPFARSEIVPSYAQDEVNSAWALPGEPLFMGRLGIGVEVVP